MTAKSPLYEDINLLVIASPEDGLDSDVISELKDNLRHLIKLDIEEVFTVKDKNVVGELTIEELSQFTHVITNTINFPKYEIIAFKLLIAVVTSEWLSRCLANGKIEPIKPYSPDSRHIFKKLTITSTSKLKIGDEILIKNAVRAFGGIFIHDLKKSVTHLISDDLENEEVQLINAYNDFCDYRNHIHVVSSRWIIDSIIAGRLLHEPDYALNGNLPKPPKLQNNKFIDFVIELSPDIGLSKGLLDSMNYLIKGLTIEGDAGINKILITNHFSEETRKITSELRSLYYLFCLFFHKSLNIYHSLLFYPTPGEMAEGMDKVVAAATNYTGDSRLYIQGLIESMGGKFTKTMKKENTHLIISKGIGRKFEFSGNWKIKRVNHVWIEDCFINWKKLDEKKYNNWPRDEIGKVRIINDVQFNGFIETNKEKNESNIHIDRNKKVEENGFKSNNAEKISRISKNSESDEITNDEKNESRHLTEKESESSLNNADDIADDIPEKEKIKVKTYRNSKIKNIKSASTASKKRKQIEIAEEAFGNEGSNPKKMTNSKKSEDTNARNKSNKPYDMVAILTGCDLDISSADKRELNKVGVKIVETPTKSVNCIIAPSILRTEKFLKIFAQDPKYILSPLFITDILGTLDTFKKASDFVSLAPNVEKYNIWNSIDFEVDSKVKKLFPKNFNKQQAEDIMRLSRHSLFKDFKFNISGGLPGGYDKVSGILKAFGATKCSQFGENSKSVIVNNKEGGNSNITSNWSEVSILVCSKDEENLCKHFAQVASKHEVRYVIIEWDAIVKSIFQGNFNMEDSELVFENGN